MIFPVIETAGLFLRRPTDADLDCALRRLGRPGTLTTAPLAGAAGFRQMPTLLTHWQLHGHGPFAVIPRGAEVPMGLVGPWQPGGWPEPEIGWLVWRQGADAVDLAAEAVTAAAAHAQAVLGWPETASFVCPSDAAALAVADLAGALADPFADRAGAIACRHPRAPRAPMPRAA